MNGFIYKITNLINNKIYVGQTKKSIYIRFNEHKKNAQDFIDGVKDFSSSRLYCAMKHYGIEKFVISQIEECQTDELNTREKYWINYYNSTNKDVGYNICKGGQCGPGGPMFRGHKHSSETKLAMSINRKGILNANFGNHWHQNNELKEIHRVRVLGEKNGMFGKHHSFETKQKIKCTKTGKIAYSNPTLNIVKMIKPEEENEYIKNGWIKGNIHKKNILK